MSILFFVILSTLVTVSGHFWDYVFYTSDMLKLTPSSTKALVIFETGLCFETRLCRVM